MRRRLARWVYETEEPSSLFDWHGFEPQSWKLLHGYISECDRVCGGFSSQSDWDRL